MAHEQRYPLNDHETVCGKKGINYRTALNWLEAGLVPGAKKHSSLAGEHWEIPETALAMEPPKRGPKASKKKNRST